MVNRFSEWLRTLFLRLGALFTRRKLDEEFDQEVRAHLALLEEEYVRQGMSRNEARYAALRSFGGVTQVKERNRRQRGLSQIERLSQDFRYALRMMRKNPGFTLMAVAMLGLGIGLNTSTFSTVSGLLLNPPPVTDPDRVMMVVTTNRAHGWDQSLVSAPDFKAWREQSHSFAEMAAAEAYQSATLTGREMPEQVSTMRVTANFFSLLGVSPLQGRTFVPGEDGTGQDHVVVLSHELWQQRFAADPSIIGRKVTIGDEPYEVVGVMPATFQLITFPSQLWMPLAFTQEQLQPDARKSRVLHVFARLRQDIDLKTAKAEIAALAARSASNSPDANKDWSTNVESLQEFSIRDLGVRAGVVVMMIAVSFILLLACVNLSNLLLTKVTARSREMAIRMAIGASRWRLVRQLLVESFMTSLLGGALGLLLSFEGIHVLRVMLSARGNAIGIALAAQLHADTRVMVFTLFLSILTTFLFGLAPAITGTRVDVQTTLKSDSRAGSGGPRNRLRGILVSTEIALALVLVMGAGFLISALIQSLRTGLGFDPSAIVTAEVSLSSSKYQDSRARAAFFREALQKLEAIPGISSAGAASNLAATGARRFPFHIQGRTETSTAERPLARYYVVTDRYRQTMGIPLLRGRDFADLDTEDTRPVVLVNKLLAERFFGKEDAVGQFIQVDSGAAPAGWRQIIGIVANVKTWPGQTADDPQIYQCYRQSPVESMTLAGRTNSDPDAIAKEVRGAIWSVDIGQPVTRIASMSTLVTEETASQDVTIKVFGTFAILASVLAAIGVYGVTSYSVTQRTREIGIRMALGASKSDVLGLILGGSGRLIALGGAIGFLVAWPLPRIFQAAWDDMQFGATWIYLAIPALIASIAILASFLPARRATRIDPLVALRYE